jgi:hypothetical protein
MYRQKNIVKLNTTEAAGSVAVSIGTDSIGVMTKSVKVISKKDKVNEHVMNSKSDQPSVHKLVSSVNTSTTTTTNVAISTSRAVNLLPLQASQTSINSTSRQMIDKLSEAVHTASFPPSINEEDISNVTQRSQPARSSLFCSPPKFNPSDFIEFESEL